MKKLLLAAAVATVGMSAAQAAPTVYGKLNVTLDQVDNNKFDGKSDVTELNSNASRLGVKGEEKLTEKLAAVYQMEWEVGTDGGSADWKQRNRFLGLKWAGLGTLKAGYYDSYFKTAAGNGQDIFNDHNQLDITNMMYGEDRLDNVIGFESDKKLLGGVQFNIQAQQGESTTAGATKGDAGKRDGFGDAISASILYDNKDLGLSLGVAGNSAVKGKYNAAGTTADVALKDVASDAFRITAAYDFSKVGINGLTLGGLWQTAEPTDDVTGYKNLQEDAYTITAAYKVGSTPWVVKAEYANANTTYTNASAVSFDNTIDQYGLGVDYYFNKQARMYGVVAQQSRDWAVDEDKTVFGIGMEYNF
ncbi:porin [Acinetobacter sp. CAAS 2-6]|uniref:porin n=1 Tax=Acinetobacter sp. CAAS 2-6 TaxID=3016358 RepID=UPI002DD6B669|nr:porin [Acinetobacter sp. CAAS 2-6]